MFSFVVAFFLTFEIVFILVWQHTLTGSKDVTFVIGAARFSHLHIVWTYLSIASDDDVTIATSLVCQRIRHSIIQPIWCCWCIGIISRIIGAFFNIISSHRSNLTAAIDALSGLGIGLNGDKGIATQQGRIAILLYALTTTKHVALDNRCACLIISYGKSDCHYAVPFHTANLTAAIDRASYRTVTDADSRSFIY